MSEPQDPATRNQPPRKPESRAPGGPADDKPVVPTRSRDDTDEGWGESSRGNDDRLRDDRPPHWGSD